MPKTGSNVRKVVAECLWAALPCAKTKKALSCASGASLLELSTAYGKAAASWKCIKCKATVGQKYINDGGVNFDLEKYRH